MNTLNKTFLPVTLDECHARGWDAPDFVYVCGDAYVDHPSFGLAIISRSVCRRGRMFPRSSSSASPGLAFWCPRA